MIRTLHPVAGTLDLTMIATFWLSIIAAEAFNGAATMLAVKTAILWGLLFLVPSLAITGATGFRMGPYSTHPRIATKRRRTPIITLNGLLVLVPSAADLQARAAAGYFDGFFALVQGTELLAGAVTIARPRLSPRDGLGANRRLARA